MGSCYSGTAICCQKAGSHVQNKVNAKEAALIKKHTKKSDAALRRMRLGRK